MENTNLINNFGYAEMYEWSNLPDENTSTFGKFVQFSDEEDKTHTIELATNSDDIIGITTVNCCCVSDDPDSWFLKYSFNEYGDVFLTEENIAVGSKEYDNLREISYIRTRKEKIYNPVISESFDPTKQYVKRTNRAEWTRVHLLGKCIVEDNGECKAGEYCKLYTGEDSNKIGTAVPATKKDKCRKWKILNRVSDNTILIFYK